MTEDDFAVAVAEGYMATPYAPMMLSPGDFQVLQTWWHRWGQHGIEPGIFLEEIREVMERKQRREPGWRPRSLAYFTPAVRERCDQVLEWILINTRVSEEDG